MKDYRLPRAEYQGELDKIFQRLGPNKARKTINRIEDEVNSHLNLEQDLNRDLAIALAFQCEEGLKASGIGNLG